MIGAYYTPDYLLQSSLAGAVALRQIQIAELRETLSPVDFSSEMQKCTAGVADFLGNHGDSLMHSVAGKTEKAFNAVAEGIAWLSFLPGGVRVFGKTWVAGLLSEQ